jgi:hypothetical protein
MTILGTRLSRTVVVTMVAAATALAGTGLRPVESPTSLVAQVEQSGCFADRCAPPETRGDWQDLFAYILQIPDDVLLKGDAATDQWVKANPRSGGGAQQASATEADAVKCVAAIGAILVGVLVPAAKLLKIKKLIKELGGAAQAARLLVGAGTAAEKTEAIAIALGSLVGELTGISGVAENCF